MAKKNKEDNFTMQDWFELIQIADKKINNYFNDSTMPKDTFTILHYMEKFPGSIESAGNEIRKLIKYGKAKRVGWYKREGDSHKYRLYKALKDDEQKV